MPRPINSLNPTNKNKEWISSIILLCFSAIKFHEYIYVHFFTVLANMENKWKIKRKIIDDKVINLTPSFLLGTKACNLENCLIIFSLWNFFYIWESAPSFHYFLATLSYFLAPLKYRMSSVSYVMIQKLFLPPKKGIMNTKNCFWQALSNLHGLFFYFCSKCG